MRARAAARALGLVVGVFLCVVAAGKGARNDAPVGAPPIPGAVAESAAKPVELPKGVGEDWWAKVQESIRKDEYSVTWDEHPSLPGLKASWQAPNRAHGFESYFTEKGVRVTRRVEGAPSWDCGLELARWGRGGSLQEASPGKPVVSANRVDLDRGAVKEWYLNDERGLEQGFTIPAPPKSRSSSIPNSEFRISSSSLFLDLALTGTLRPVISEDGQAVDFYLPDGNVAVLSYARLKVTDATGKELPALFGGIPGGIRISIDDSTAVYPVTVDPLATSPAWTATGEATSSSFGCSVTTAGDVNGDGYSDVVVGASGYNPGSASGTGRAYLYLGGPTGLSATPAWTATGQSAGSAFGYCVATAGDVNGDGYADVVVGAFAYDPGSAVSTGRAYLYLGGPSGLSPTPAWTATGEGANNNFGYCVAAAGDVNGDGYSDVVVGAYGYNLGSASNAGRAYLYLGSASGLSATPAWTATGQSATVGFGYCVATAGDVNGDGYADVIVGDPNSGAGMAYLYLGGASAPYLTSASWNPTVVGFFFGVSVATAGDVNGDGYSDVIVGACSYGGYPGWGNACLYLGGPSGLSTTPAWTAEGESMQSCFGFSVATAGDVNGDGYADVLVGAYGGGGTQGKAYLYLGGPSGLSAAPAWTALGEGTRSRFGFSVATAGDVNGDGFSDVVVGDVSYGSSVGKAYLYLGGPATLSTASTWAPETANENSGAVVASAGDVNGDGYSDIVVGTPFYGSQTGKAYLYLGGPAGLSATSSWSATGEAADDGFGYSLASAGDVNGDGYSDVVVGALGYGGNTGRAYLYLGGPSGLSSTPSWIATGEAAGDYFGHCVASAGDVNGDGYSDLLVGSQWNPYTPGKAYLYLGGPTGLSGTASWTALGEVNSDGFGSSLATAGDVNGDGYSDVLIGAPDYGSSAGKVYLYLGNPAGLPSAASWTATGATPENFGDCVATAGDVNGDGYSDILVGAPSYSGYTGKVYLYLGGSSGLAASASWTATGEVESDSFGLSVATAGDVNGDGYSDVIVGAPFRSLYTGKVYLYLGGPAGLSGAASWTAEPGASIWALGDGVAAAGDVNGDGYSDVIVSAPSRYLFEGHAFLYYGNGGTGVPVPWRQMRSDLSAPIAPLGRAEDGLFALAAVGRTPFGRGKVMLEWQVATLGGSFSTALNPIQFGPVWSDSGLAGLFQSQQLWLMYGEGPYIWRLRTRYSPVTAPFQSHGPWLTLAANGLMETDLRRVPSCVLPTGVCSITSVTESGTSCTLTWTDPNQPGRRTGWNIRRSSDASLTKSSWPIMGLNVQSDPWTDSTGDIPASGVWFYEVTTYDANCPAEGPF